MICERLMVSSTRFIHRSSMLEDTATPINTSNEGTMGDVRYSFSSVGFQSDPARASNVSAHPIQWYILRSWASRSFCEATSRWVCTELVVYYQESILSSQSTCPEPPVPPSHQVSRRRPSSLRSSSCTPYMRWDIPTRRTAYQHTSNPRRSSRTRHVNNDVYQRYKSAVRR